MRRPGPEVAAIALILAGSLALFAPALFGPSVMRHPARHVDVLPTVLDFLGLAPLPGLPGRSLPPCAARWRRSPGPCFPAWRC